MRISCSETIRVLSILIVLIYGVLCPHSLMAIDCTSDYIELNTQARIDSFQSDYGGGGTCDTVPGTLRIGGPDVVDLTPLSALITIRDQFQIRQTNNLADLEALSALTSVGGEKNDAAGSFYIFDNEALTSLNGLTGLVSIGGQLYVSENPALTSLDGLSALASVGRIEISNNDSLTDISGISAVITGDFPGSITVGGNGALTDIDDLSLLTSVSGGLSISHNYALVNLDGLSTLSFAGSLDIRGNITLADIAGLSSLSEVGGLLQIIGNTSLTELDGLSALISAGTLNVRSNETLINLDGLSGLQAIHGSLRVDQNLALMNCQGIVTLIDPIDNHDPGPGPGVSGIPDIAVLAEIQANGDGCNSVPDILGEVPLGAINAGLNDAWFNPVTDGQGFLIVVYPVTRQIFVAWFTYDTERPPTDVMANLGEPGHRWLIALGDFDENFADLTLYLTSGGVFDSEMPVPSTDPYGEMTLEFSSCNKGTVTYQIPSTDNQGTVLIERIALDNVSSCYLLERRAIDANPAVE